MFVLLFPTLYGFLLHVFTSLHSTTTKLGSPLYLHSPWLYVYCYCLLFAITRWEYYVCGRTLTSEIRKLPIFFDSILEVVLFIPAVLTFRFPGLFLEKRLVVTWPYVTMLDTWTEAQAECKYYIVIQTWIDSGLTHDWSMIDLRSPDYVDCCHTRTYVCYKYVIRPNLTSQTVTFYKRIDQSEISATKKVFVSTQKLYNTTLCLVVFVS